MQFNFWKTYRKKGETAAFNTPAINSIVELDDGIKIKNGIEISLVCDPYVGVIGLYFSRHDKERDEFISETVSFPDPVSATSLPENIYVSLKDILIDWQEESAIEIEDLLETAMIRFLLKTGCNISIEYDGICNKLCLYLEINQLTYSSKVEISIETLQEFLEEADDYGQSLPDQ